MMMKRVPFLPNGFIAASLALGITAVGIADPLCFSAQMPEPRPVLELAELLFERTVSQPYTYNIGNRRDPFVPLRFSDSPDDSDVTELSSSGNPEGIVTLLGIISGKRGYQALLKLPNGEHVMVGPGSLLDKTTGRVTRITRNTVVLTRLLYGKADNQILEKTFVLPN
jgi:Tfp pilus assembly protein PilP